MYLVYIMEERQTQPSVVDIDELKSIAVLLTNHGLRRPADDPIHFSVTYSGYNLSAKLPGYCSVSLSTVWRSVSHCLCAEFHGKDWHCWLERTTSYSGGKTSHNGDHWRSQLFPYWMLKVCQADEQWQRISYQVVQPVISLPVQTLTGISSQWRCSIYLSIFIRPINKQFAIQLNIQ